MNDRQWTIQLNRLPDQTVFEVSKEVQDEIRNADLCWVYDFRRIGMSADRWRDLGFPDAITLTLDPVLS